MKRSINNKIPNKGGRPTKKLSEKRKYRITVKMATEEYYAMKLKAKNAGVSASEIVRMAIRDCHIRARLTTEQADYIRKLCGMANNLNQLTRKAHREGVRLHYGQCQHLLLSLENIFSAISAYDGKDYKRLRSQRYCRLYPRQEEACHAHRLSRGTVQ